jgi:hypothetical protein
MVEEPDPGAGIEVGLKLADAPEGRPDAESDTAELKPPEIVVETEAVPELLCEIEREAGDEEIAKSGLLVAVTASETLVEWVVPPPAPVTAIE